MARFFLAQLVASRWLTQLLRGSSEVTAEMPAKRIVANLAPSTTEAHVTHNFAGLTAGGVARPMGGSIEMVTMYWDVTAWNPSMSQQSMEPVMLAIARTLLEVDDEVRGKTHHFTDGDRSFDIFVDYDGPNPVPLEVAPADVWAPVRERFILSLSPRD